MAKASGWRWRYTQHARMQMRRRGLSEADIVEVLAQPEQIVEMRPGRVVYQRRQVDAETGRTYLLRVVVDVSEDEGVIVTAYRTRKVSKYWREA